MHRATGEAANLRGQLTAILTDPALGPLAKQVIQGTPEADAAIRAAHDRYKAAPDDIEAFKVLLETSGAQSEDRVLRRLNEQAIEAENQHRSVQRQLVVKDAVTNHVAAIAPDVAAEDFWLFAPVAQRETPPSLRDPAARIEWQTTRAIELARARFQGVTRNASTAAAEAAAIQHAAGAVMPAGNAAPGAPGAPAPERLLTFAEQAQANKVRLGPA